jgi:MarR-like DNA-binding transcriptional regulator SgrR of sgrS sRNA
MNNPRPFTPQTLADRWGCSAQHIRNLVTSRRAMAEFG